MQTRIRLNEASGLLLRSPLIVPWHSEIIPTLTPRLHSGEPSPEDIQVVEQSLGIRKGVFGILLAHASSVEVSGGVTHSP